jgi:hypothetical protein
VSPGPRAKKSTATNTAAITHSREYKLRFLIIVLMAGLVSNLAFASQEKMCGSEEPVFQCEMKSGKNLALCPRYVEGKLSGVQYKFGHADKNDLTFPSTGFDFDSFKSNHYVRYQVDYKRIKFSIGIYTYTIYSDYDGGDGSLESNTSGVTISKSNGAADVQVPCTKVYSNKLQVLISKVKCDSDDALGCSD